MRVEGLWGQWRQGALAIRALAHISVAAESTHGRSPAARIVFLAGSLAADTWIARRTRTTRRRTILETAVNAVDVAAWSWLTRHDPIHMRALSFATVAPNAMETAFRLRAGTTAVPVIRPPIAWHPASDGDHDGSGRASPVGRFATLAGETALDALPTIGAMAAVRHRRGLRLGAGPLAWSAIGAWGGFALARVRDRAQASTTRVWENRTQYLIEEARIRSRVQSALVHNVTEVDPRALLTFLERAGSVPAGRLLDEMATAPSAALADAADHGLTLSATVDQRMITPTRHRTRWMPRSQVRLVRDAMADIDRQLAPLGDAAPDDGQLQVTANDASGLVLSYRGFRIEAAQPVPDLAIRLEPTIWPVVASLVLTMATVLPSADRVSRVALGTAFVTHGTALARLLRTPPEQRRADRVTAALLTGSALAMNFSVGHSAPLGTVTSDDGDVIQENAGTSATQPVMFLLGTSWHDLPREAPRLLAVATLGWLYSLRLDQGRSWHSVVTEAAFLMMPLLANLGVGKRTRAEAELLDETLQERLADTIAATARIEAREEIDRFLTQLDCVITELPELHPSLGDDEVADITQTYRNERERIAAVDPLELINW